VNTHAQLKFPRATALLSRTAGALLAAAMLCAAQGGQTPPPTKPNEPPPDPAQMRRRSDPHQQHSESAYMLTLRVPTEVRQLYRQTLYVSGQGANILSRAEGAMVISPEAGGEFRMASQTTVGHTILNGARYQASVSPFAFRKVDSQTRPLMVGEGTPGEWRAVLMSTIYRPAEPVMVGEKWEWDEPADPSRGTRRVVGTYRLERVVEDGGDRKALVLFRLVEKGVDSAEGDRITVSGEAVISILTGEILRMDARFNSAPTREGPAMTYRALLEMSSGVPTNPQAEAAPVPKPADPPVSPRTP
jgi:hypothetical protein